MWVPFLSSKDDSRIEREGEGSKGEGEGGGRRARGEDGEGRWRGGEREGGVPEKMEGRDVVDGDEVDGSRGHDVLRWSWMEGKEREREREEGRREEGRATSRS